jgi:hypothetical protein
VSCKAGGFTVASTAPGQQAALSSPNEAYVLVLSPTGLLTITERATSRPLMNSGAQPNCFPPFSLVLLPNGLLVLRDKRGTVLWSSGGACRGNTTCYSYALQNDGQLVVRDAHDVVVWSSTSASADTEASRRLQIVSGGKLAISCIHSGPLPRSSYLISSALTYKLALQQQGAQLQLLDTSTGALGWAPPGALTGQAPARFCITSDSSLQLTGSSQQQLWSSGSGNPAAAGPYVAYVTDAGCLEVVDAACALVWSNHGSSGGSGKRRMRPPKATMLGAKWPFSPLASRLAPPQSARAVTGQVSPQPNSRGPRPAPASGSGNTWLPAPTLGRKTLPPATGSAAQLLHVPLAAEKRPPLQDLRGLQAKPASPALAAVQAAALLPVGSGGAAADSTAAAAGTLHTACSLQKGQPCGGISMCGADGGCTNMGCCAGQLTCLRQSDFLWLCTP